MAEKVAKLASKTVIGRSFVAGFLLGTALELTSNYRVSFSGYFSNNFVVAGGLCHSCLCIYDFFKKRKGSA